MHSGEERKNVKVKKKFNSDKCYEDDKTGLYDRVSSGRMAAIGWGTIF